MVSRNNSQQSRPDDNLIFPKPPQGGEATGNQADVISMPMQVKGFGNAANASFVNFDKIRTNPTVALARIVATAPIKSASWSFTADRDTPDDHIKVIEEDLASIMPMLVRQSCSAMDYGVCHWEKIFALRDGLIRLVKLKHLNVRITSPRVDVHGKYVGLRQRHQTGMVERRTIVDVPVEQSLSYVHDPRYDGDFWGQSRNRNIIKPWAAWEQSLDRFGIFSQVGAAPIPMIEYPVGESRDKHGNVKSNYDIAQGLLGAMSRAEGVAMPNTLMRDADVWGKRGVDPDKLRQWHITFVEAKNRAGDQIINGLVYLDKLLLRGWLVPERSATEGQHGTKAEAQVHSDIVADSADEFLTDLARYVSWYVINPLLVYNFGPEAEGTIRAEPSKVNDQQKGMLGRIIESILTQPGSLDLFDEVIDWDAAFAQFSVPTRGSFADMDEKREALRQSPGPPTSGQVPADMPGVV